VKLLHKNGPNSFPSSNIQTGISIHQQALNLLPVFFFFWALYLSSQS